MPNFLLGEHIEKTNPRPGYAERLLRALFQNFVEISQVPLAFVALYRLFDQPKLWACKGVIDSMFLAPAYEFPRVAHLPPREVWGTPVVPIDSRLPL